MPGNNDTEPVGRNLWWGWLIGWKTLPKFEVRQRDICKIGFKFKYIEIVLFVYMYCIYVYMRTICKPLLVLLSLPRFLSSSRVFPAVSALSCPEMCKIPLFSRHFPPCFHSVFMPSSENWLFEIYSVEHWLMYVNRGAVYILNFWYFACNMLQWKVSLRSHARLLIRAARRMWE